ncbi:MAG: hypothetical protein ACJA01_003279 [Saprospiraceae bacterium]|jgi:hypothetical protein
MSRLENINLFVTGVLVGLIWIIQLLHYPVFIFISPDQFLAFHDYHTYYMGFIAAPLMVIELALSFYLGLQNRKYILPLLIVILIWISTFLIQVPLHEQLAKEMQVTTINKLIDTNWIRTILWSSKATLLLYWYQKQ